MGMNGKAGNKTMANKIARRAVGRWTVGTSSQKIQTIKVEVPGQGFIDGASQARGVSAGSFSSPRTTVLDSVHGARPAIR